MSMNSLIYMPANNKVFAIHDKLFGLNIARESPDIRKPEKVSFLIARPEPSLDRSHRDRGDGPAGDQCSLA